MNIDGAGRLDMSVVKLKAYRASVLKAAVEGRLVPTEASLARAEKRDYEPGDAPLARILKERRRRWEETELSKLKAAGKPPKNDKWPLVRVGDIRDGTVRILNVSATTSTCSPELLPTPFMQELLRRVRSTEPRSFSLSQTGMPSSNAQQSLSSMRVGRVTPLNVRPWQRW